jgi:hypothetical protein
MELPVEYKSLSIQEKRKVRERYVFLQKGKCHYCNAPLSGEPRKDIADKKVTPRFYPKGFFKNPIHLHHSHDDGLTIGAVHAHCNAVLWEYEGE